MMAFPLLVALMDDDPFALRFNASLLARDPRTAVCAEAGTPQELEREVDRLVAEGRSPEKVFDAVVLDAEYAPIEQPLGDLIMHLREQIPNATAVVLAQYGSPAIAREAVRAGVHGFLLKCEIKFAIAAAVIRACRKPFVFTPGVKAMLRGEFGYLLNQADQIQPCKPRLTPRQRQVLELCLVYGMSARQVAEEINVEPETVEKYRNEAYQVLRGDWADETDWAGIDLDQLKPEERALILFTALKKP